MKSQAIFKSIEKLSDSRILDIYLRVLKKEERTTGALETSAGVPLMVMKGNIMWKSVLFLSKKKNGKKERLKERLRIRNKKKRKEKGGKKKHLAGFEPPPSIPKMSFSAPHTIRPPARGRVTSFPAHTNLTDK